MAYTERGSNARDCYAFLVTVMSSPWLPPARPSFTLEASSSTSRLVGDVHISRFPLAFVARSPCGLQR